MNIDALLKELYAYSMFSIRLGLDNICLLYTSDAADD